MSNTKVFAHRGASGYAPENTLEAFALAIRQGADGIELDVQLSSDGIPVVIHDETIDRVTDKTGYVKDYTLQELKELTVLKDRFPAYNQSKIPTLKEVLEAVKPSGIQVNIELKTGIYWYPDIEKKVAEIVEETGMKDRIVYSSFNHYSVQPAERNRTGCRDGVSVQRRNIERGRICQRDKRRWFTSGGISCEDGRFPGRI